MSGDGKERDRSEDAAAPETAAQQEPDAAQVSVVTAADFEQRAKPVFDESAEKADTKPAQRAAIAAANAAAGAAEPAPSPAAATPQRRDETMRSVRHAAADVADSVRALVTELLAGAARPEAVQEREPGALVKAEPRARIAARAVDTFIFILLARSITFVGPLAALCYLLLGDALIDGASVGKKLFGLRAVKADDDSPVGIFDALLRNAPLGLAGLFVLIPVIGWFLFGTLGLLILGFETVMLWRDDQGVRAGDILAGTKVIDRRPAREPEDA